MGKKKLRNMQCKLQVYTITVKATYRQTNHKKLRLCTLVYSQIIGGQKQKFFANNMK